jgi:hypothetical protein
MFSTRKKKDIHYFSDLPLIDFRISISHMDFPKIVEGGFKQMLELLGGDNAPFDVRLFTSIFPFKNTISAIGNILTSI